MDGGGITMRDHTKFKVFELAKVLGALILILFLRSPNSLQSKQPD